MAIRILDNEKTLRFVETNLICKAALLDRSSQSDITEFDKIRQTYVSLLMGKVETPSKADKLTEMTTGFRAMQKKVLNDSSSFTIGPVTKDDIPTTNIKDFYNKVSETDER